MNTINTVDLEVQGMSCGSCVNHVTRALKPIPGVTDVAVDLQAGHVRVSGNLDAGEAPLVAALTEAGYPAKLAGIGAPVPSSSAPSAQPKVRRGGGCCCGCG